MRRLGIHSCCWTAGSTQEDVEKAMEASAECGFRLIELAYLPVDRFDLDRLARRAASLDLGIAVSLGLPEQSDVSSEDRDTVQRGEALLADVVAATRDLGGTTLGGILYSAHRKYAAQPSALGRRNAIAAIARTADLADAAGVGLVLEVANRFETNLLNTTAQGLAFIAATGSETLRLHLDTFHMNIEETNPAAAIRLAGDRLGYLHIGESNRGHLGDGVVDFDGIFDALLDIGYAGDITFESFSNAVVDPGMAIACAVWRNTWTDDRALACHAKAFIDIRCAEAERRRETVRRP